MLELEDRAADRLDGVVQGRHRLVDPAGDLGVRHHRGHALELQAGGEELLDHHVVQVARDPLPVGDQGQLLRSVDGLAAVERQRGLVGEGGQQLPLAGVVEGRGPVEQRGQRQPPGRGGPGPAMTTASRSPTLRRCGGADASSSSSRTRSTSSRTSSRSAGSAGDRVPVVGVGWRAARWRAPRHGTRRVDDLAERVLAVHRRLEVDADLGGRLQPAPSSLAESIGSGVVDDQAGRSGPGPRRAARPAR